MTSARPPATPETLERLRALFDEGVELPPAAREAWLRARAPDPALQPWLRALLDADARVDDVFATPATAWAAQLQPDDDEVDALLGTTVGGFRLLERLGQGGSAVVFRAEREVAGALQQVALKLMRTGLFSPEAQRRFRREQAILLQLTHPQIARLIDAGSSEAGIPFIAMELVEGASLGDYARRAALSRDARLALLAELARTVDAAHRALVVHRDLKPSNVLVGNDGRLRVLDFGIAKLLDDPDETGTQQLALTPGYAAPEQYRSGPLTTAVDVYALGVMAGELLLELRLGADAMPPADADAAARRRLQHDAELHTVLRTALAEEPAQRYASARHLADDLERLRRDEPVAAHPPSRRYRLAKFLVRHRVGVALGALALAALLGLTALAWWQRDEARAQAARADTLRDFVFEAFADAEPSVPRDGPATVQDAVRRALAESADAGRGDPRARLELRLRLGQVLQRQGDLAGAQAVFDEVDGEARRRFGGDDALAQDVADQLAQLAMVRGDFALARTLIDARLQASRGQRDARRIEHLSRSAVLATRVRERERALRDGAEALALARALGDAEVLRGALNDWGIVLLALDALPEAVTAHEELLQLNRARFGDQHQWVANVQAALARAHRRLGDLERAEIAARAAVEIDRAIYPGPDRHAAVNLNALLLVLRAQGDIEGALAAGREALAINRATLGDEHPDTAIALYGVAELECVREDYAAAVPLLREALDSNERRFGNEHWNTAVVRAQLGFALGFAGDAALGFSQLEQAIAALEALGDPDPGRIAAAYDKRVRLALHAGDLAGADDALARLARHADGAPEAYAPWRARRETLHALRQLSASQPAAALAAVQAALQAEPHETLGEPWRHAERRVLRARAVQGTDGTDAAAVDAARAAVAALRFVPPSLRDQLATLPP